ncbi:MAG: hypothetical protein ABII00_01015 [Elusimicrobiota bacterium]
MTRLLRAAVCGVLCNLALAGMWAAQADARFGASKTAPLKEPKPGPAAAVLETALGSKALAILHEYGYVLLGGTPKDGRRVIHVQWEPLRSLNEHAGAWLGFLELYKQNRRGVSIEGDLKRLRALQTTPTAGLISGPVRAALDALALHMEAGSELGKRLPAASRQKLLFDTRWGEDFLERTHVDLLPSAAEAADEFFMRHLTGPGESLEPADHFLGHVRNVYGEELAEQLGRDRTAGEASKELRKWIGKYLADQTLLWNFTRTRGRLRSIERPSGLKRTLKDLRAVVEPLSRETGLLERLREEMKAEGPAPRLRFTGPELHVQNAAGSADVDVGDTIVVSMAYWIEGLEERETARITEVAYADRGAGGVADRVQNYVERRKGGPHSFTARVPVRSSETITYRLHLDAPGSDRFQREIEIKVSPRYHDLLLEAGKAEAKAEACQLQEAVALLESLQDKIAPLAAKTRFARLLATLGDRARTVSKQIDRRESLNAALDGARLYASADQCDFRADRARRALSLLADLPPGCDAAQSGDTILSAELQSLVEATDRRRLHQEAFLKGASKARELARACRAQDAAEQYAAALALLDAEPEARCGQWEKEYTLIRISELPRAAAADALATAIDESVGRASRRFADGDYPGTTGILLPLMAAIDAMPESRCYASLRTKAEQLAEAAGVALAPPDPEDVRASLPKDSVEKALKDVLAERERHQRGQRSEAERERIRQAPHPPEEDAAR